MANDTSTPIPGSTDFDASANGEHDTFFPETHGGADEDAFFGAVQLAQAGPAPVIVPVPQGENVIRVNVTPGEILELASPFDPGSALLGREDNGNLAIKVGDVTVILVGYVDANDQAPVVVETSDGKPIDIAVLLASTDPSLDIQTAAGPGAQGPGGQGADNTGGILAHLQGGEGLGGLNAVGAQDQTDLSYNTIDNSIIQDRFLAAAAGGTGGPGDIGEPFLVDPPVFRSDFGSDLTFEAFIGGLSSSPNPLLQQGFNNGWADFNGTSATPNDISGLHKQTTITFTGTAGESLFAFLSTEGLEAQGIKSDGAPLTYETSIDGSTVFAFRGDGKTGDGALVFVVHIDPSGTGPTYDVDYYLVNRLDHPGHDNPGTSDTESAFNDLLDIPIQVVGYPEGQEVPEPYTETIHLSFKDDIPVADPADYYNDDPSIAFKLVKDPDATPETVGKVDEDWLKNGNHDDDNLPATRPGDDKGGTCVTGELHVNFGADGPAGKDGEFDCGCDDERSGDRSGLAGLIALPPRALELVNYQDFSDPDCPFISNGQKFTSDGNPLYVYEHNVDPCGIETLVVGYDKPDDKNERFFANDVSPDEGDTCFVPVFTLILHTDPDDPQFQQFTFILQGPIDQLTNGDPQQPLGPSIESSLLLLFDVQATDDDGDAIITKINIQVNDDAPKAFLDADTVSPSFCIGSIFSATVEHEVTTRGSTSGNVVTGVGDSDNDLLPDMKGADLAVLVTAIAFGATEGIAGPKTGFEVAGQYGILQMNEDGGYTYYLTDADAPNGQKEVFTYTITDADGDKSTTTLTIDLSIPTGNPDARLTLASYSESESSSAHYAVEKSVITDYDVYQHAGSLQGSSHHLTDNDGGHALSGGSAGDRLDGNGGDDVLQGRGGDDLLFGGSNADDLYGGSGNDTLDGGDGADRQSGGKGDDTFLNVDAADLDGSRTFDGTHSIDGGKGIDTVDLSHLSSFDSAQAARIENIEALSFTGGGATAISLNYDAAFGITQVGGLHSFTIKGDAGQDTVQLNPSSGNAWTQTGTDVAGSDGHFYNVFEAGAGAAKVTVSVEHGVTVDAV